MWGGGKTQNLFRKISLKMQNQQWQHKVADKPSSGGAAKWKRVWMLGTRTRWDAWQVQEGNTKHVTHFTDLLRVSFRAWFMVLEARLNSIQPWDDSGLWELSVFVLYPAWTFCFMKTDFTNQRHVILTETALCRDLRVDSGCYDGWGGPKYVKQLSGG